MNLILLMELVASWFLSVESVWQGEKLMYKFHKENQLHEQNQFHAENINVQVSR